MPVDLSIPNSIIQSYLAGTQLRRQREQDTLEQQNKERQFADFEKQLDAHLKDVEEQQKIRRQQQELHEKQFRLAARQTIMQGVKEGILKPSESTVQSPVPAITPFGNFPAPASVPTPGAMYEMEGVQVPQKDFIPLEQRRAAESDWFQKQLAMQSAAKVAEAKQLQPLALEKIQETGKQHIAQAQTTAQSSLLRTLATIEGRHADVAATNAARLQAAQLRGNLAQDPEVLKQNILAAGLGETKPLGMSKNDMVTRSGLKDMDWAPFDDKRGAALANQKEIHSVIDAMSALADKLPETKSGILGSLIRSKIPDEEIKVLQDRIRMVAGNIARTEGGERGVLTERDLSRALNGLVTATMTKKTGKTQVANLKQMEIKKINNVLLSGISNPLQRVMILQKHELDPEVYGGTVEYKGKQIPIYHRKEDGTYEYYKNGKYFDLTGGQ